MITVSVIMITYGHEKYIEEAIAGVLMQECDFDVELIIADDNSPDSTEEVVKIFLGNHPKAHLVKYTKHKENKGMQPNFAWAHGQCKGKYIAICEGDDYWTDPYKLQKQVNFLKSNPEYVLYGHLVSGTNMNTPGVITYPQKEADKHFDQSELHKNHIPTLSAVFRNCLSCLPDAFIKAPTGDFFLWALVGKYGKYYVSSEVMANYRMHPGGTWSGISRITQLMNAIKTSRLAAEYITNNKGILMSIKVKAKSGLMWSLKNFDIKSAGFFVKILLLLWVVPQRISR